MLGFMMYNIVTYYTYVRIPIIFILFDTDSFMIDT